MKVNTSRFLNAAFAAALFGAAAAPSFAALRRVDQTVFGMDCAPCAYGVEAGLKKLAGVKDVKVSLNEGNAVIELAPDNAISIADIRETITNGGFTAKAARVKISGRLTRDGKNLVLVMENDARYQLGAAEQAPEAWNKLQRAPDGATVVLQGDVPETEPTQLLVREVLQS